MDSKQFTTTYILANSSYFAEKDLPILISVLERLPEENQNQLSLVTLKNPLIVLVLSLLVGGFAIDRFYLGDIFLGILKIISVFVVIGFVWVIADIFLCYKKAKHLNLVKVVGVASLLS